MRFCGKKYGCRRRWAAVLALLVVACGALADEDHFRVVTYNIHGGHGDLVGNLSRFRDNMLDGEDMLCLQEVPLDASWEDVKSVFSDYPYTYQTISTTTDWIWPWQTRPAHAVTILSKLPFSSTHSKLIQIDPGGNRWQRHGQHVQIEIGAKTVHIFHIHNTYNFDNDDFASEKSGMLKFRDYVYERLGVSDIAAADNLIMLGDFNIFSEDVREILPTPGHAENGRDHISSIPLMERQGVYPTYASNLSDHNAVWGEFDIESPPVPAWTRPPEPRPIGTEVVMSAERVTDANGVEYYFANRTIADGSHDSGWQSSGNYRDSGLDPESEYEYAVKTRDLSRNRNESQWSERLSVRTAFLDTDLDGLPDDWERDHFGGIEHSSGALDEDSDQDGLSDREELLVGTDPTNPASNFRMSISRAVGGTLELRWPVRAGRSYRIMHSSNPGAGWEMAALVEAGADASGMHAHRPELDGRVSLFRIESID
jgi:endonuclease/exonuclease/phosphatase family metal-dependent hydrolase